MSTAELAQSDVNRMATLGMRDNLASLMLLADKLYRRNPTEWRKSGTANTISNSTSREAALARLKSAIDTNTAWPELQGKRDIAALSLALGPTSRVTGWLLSFTPVPTCWLPRTATKPIFT